MTTVNIIKIRSHLSIQETFYDKVTADQSVYFITQRIEYVSF